MVGCGSLIRECILQLGHRNLLVLREAPDDGLARPEHAMRVRFHCNKRKSSVDDDIGLYVTVHTEFKYVFMYAVSFIAGEPLHPFVLNLACLCFRQWSDFINVKTPRVVLSSSSVRGSSCRSETKRCRRTAPTPDSFVWKWRLQKRRSERQKPVLCSRPGEYDLFMGNRSCHRHENSLRFESGWLFWA